MAEFFMGQELIQGELPANSPKPVETPPEGVIMTDVTMDGWKRRYIYIAMSGSAPEEILISEIPPNRVSGAAVAVDGPEMGSVAVEAQEAVFTSLPSERRAAAKGARIPVRMTTPFQQPQRSAGVPMAQQQQPVQMGVPVQQSTVPVSTISIQKAAPQAPIMVQMPQAPVVGGQVSVPYAQRPVEQKPELAGNLRLSNSLDAIKPVSVAPIADVNRMASAPITERSLPMLGQSSRSLPLTTQEAKRDLYQVSNPIVQGAPISAGMAQMGGSPSAFMNNQVPLKGLGQAATPAPEAPPPSGGKCPGAVEMPDGRVIEPEDGVSLKDLCELMPFLVETLTNMQQSKGLAPGQKLSVVGQKGQGATAVPTAQGSFGPAGQGQGAFGSTGGGMSFGGGGGGPGPTGPQGPVGVVGATGPGSIVEPPLIKTDGDFIAAPGAFIAVPGTAVGFSLAVAGVAQFDLLATVGVTSGAAGLSQSLQLGLRIDGTDYALITRLLHTFVGGVGEFMLGQTIHFAMSLGAGPHTVEVILRGLIPGEFGGAGIGIAGAVCATPSVPLVLTVSHS